MSNQKTQATSGFERRDFLKGMAFGGIGMASMGLLGAVNAKAYAAEAEANGEAAAMVTAPAEPKLTANATPEEYAAKGGSTMSVVELNQRRHELVDSKGDFECEDGTVIPAIWNKLRALIDTYGYGVGSAKTSASEFEWLQMMFEDEDQAQAYLDMPYGVVFTAQDFAAESGRDEAECAQICEDMAMRGLLWRALRGGVYRYHQVAVAHGMFEYNLDRFWEDKWVDKYIAMLNFDDTESGINGINAGTSFYYSIPCDESIVADEKILLHDDYKKIVERNSVIAVSPCQCRLAFQLLRIDENAPELFSQELIDYTAPKCGHPVDTCLSFGEEAQYYIDKGIGRQIDQEEALAILQRSVDAGLVLQSAYTKDSEIICSCSGDCCGILSTYVKLGPDACESLTAMPNYSHYNLNYDKDACIQCGSCVARCPMTAIEMDEEGYPAVNAMCVRCGQCGIVCPVNARTLSAKAPGEYIDLPEGLLEDYNLKASYRFDHDLIH